MADPSELQTIHTFWTATITVGVAIVAFFTKRLINEVDKKADKSELNDLKEVVSDFLERQDRQHAANTGRLDQILLTLSERRDRRQEDRNR